MTLLVLMLVGYMQSIYGLDSSSITVTLKDKASTIMKFKPLEVIFTNHSMETITIQPDGIPAIIPVDKNELKQYIKSIFVLGGSVIGITTFIAGGMLVLAESEAPKRTMMLVGCTGLVSIFFLAKPWIQYGDDFLVKEAGFFDPITILPGQSIKKHIFVDATTQLPQSLLCRVSDSTGAVHEIPVLRVSA